MGFKLLVTWNCLFATLVILGSSPLHSIISFVFFIVGSCVFLLLLRIEFLAFILLLVYIGALAVLFLFVMMLLGINTEAHISEDKSKSFTVDNLIYTLFFFKLFYLVTFVTKKLSILRGLFSSEYVRFNGTQLTSTPVDYLTTGSDASNFLILFTEKYHLTFVLGFILLFAMIGSIALCIKQRVW